MQNNSKTIIAVDFDGTLVETVEYPNIVKLRFNMFDKCIELIKKGYCLVLWTCRCGEDLEKALKTCVALGLNFEWVNENPDWAIKQWGNDCRKIGATYYIDDKNLSIGEFLSKEF